MLHILPERCANPFTEPSLSQLPLEDGGTSLGRSLFAPSDKRLSRKQVVVRPSGHGDVMVVRQGGNASFAASDASARVEMLILDQPVTLPAGSVVWLAKDASKNINANHARTMLEPCAGGSQ